MLVDAPSKFLRPRRDRMSESVGWSHVSDYAVAQLWSFNLLLWDPKQDYRRPVKRMKPEQGEAER